MTWGHPDPRYPPLEGGLRDTDPARPRAHRGPGPAQSPSPTLTPRRLRASMGPGRGRRRRRYRFGGARAVRGSGAEAAGGDLVPVTAAPAPPPLCAAPTARGERGERGGHRAETLAPAPGPARRGWSDPGRTAAPVNPPGADRRRYRGNPRGPAAIPRGRGGAGPPPAPRRPGGRRLAPRTGTGTCTDTGTSTNTGTCSGATLSPAPAAAPAPASAPALTPATAPAPAPATTPTPAPALIPARAVLPHRSPRTAQPHGVTALRLWYPPSWL